jgi:hypothetical protein
MVRVRVLSRTNLQSRTRIWGAQGFLERHWYGNSGVCSSSSKLDDAIRRESIPCLVAFRMVDMTRKNCSRCLQWVGTRTSWSHRGRFGVGVDAVVIFLDSPLVLGKHDSVSQ